MIYFVLFVNASLLFICVAIKGFDFSNPTVLCFIFAVVSNICSSFLFNDYSVIIKGDVTSICIIGSLSIFFGGVIGDKIAGEHHFDYLSNQKLFISNGQVVFATIFAFIVLGVTYHDIQNVVNIEGVSVAKIIQTTHAYRPYSADHYHTLPLYTTSMIRVLKVLAYIFSYSFAYDYNYKKKVNLKYFPTIIAYGLCDFIRAQRNSWIYVALTIATFLVLLIPNKTVNKIPKHTIRINVKLLRIVVLSLVATVLLFSNNSVRHAISRNTKWSSFRYITHYFGISLIGFQQWLNQGGKPQYDFFPIYSFPAGVKSILYFFPSLNIKEAEQVRYIYANGVGLSNTFTSFKRYYNDYGYIGVIVFSFLCAFILSYFHKKILNGQIGLFGIIMYIGFAVGFYLTYYDEHLFRQISGGLIVDILSLIILLKVFKVGKNIDDRKPIDRRYSKQQVIAKARFGSWRR